MIDRSHALPVTRQARELGISRGSVYYLPRPTSPTDLLIMRRIDELHMEFSSGYATSMASAADSRSAL